MEVFVEYFIGLRGLGLHGSSPWATIFNINLTSIILSNHELGQINIKALIGYITTRRMEPSMKLIN